MKRVSPHLSLLAGLFFMSYILTIVTSSSHADVTERIDVIGSFSLQNEEQCRRLCWYRVVCTSYSFCSQCDRSDVNCVLHSSHVEGGTNTHAAHQDYTEKPATGLNPGHGCSGRPCGQKELCVPGLGGRHQCVPRPAVCPTPPVPVPASRLVYSDLEQDERITLECEEHFVFSPRNAVMDLQCQVNSRWSSPMGECLQAEFFNTSSPFTGLIPWDLTAGWGLCFRATYQGTFYLNLKINPDDPIDSGVIPFHLALNPGTIGMKWNMYDNNIGWHTSHDLGALQVNVNEMYALKFTLYQNALGINLRGNAEQDYTIVFDGQSDLVNLTGVRYIMTDRAADISYVNLVSHEVCDL